MLKKELYNKRRIKALKRNTIKKARKLLYGSTASVFNIDDHATQKQRSNTNKLTVNLCKMKPEKRSHLLASLNKLESKLM